MEVEGSKLIVNGRNNNIYGRFSSTSGNWCAVLTIFGRNVYYFFLFFVKVIIVVVE